MRNYDAQKDRGPLGYAGGVAVYATTLIVATHIVTMVLTTIAVSAGARGLLDFFSFSSGAIFHHGFVWKLITYPFVNEPSLWFAWNMFIIFFCGKELETFFGRRAFLGFYASAILIASASSAVFGIFIPCEMSGCWLPHFAVFAAYAFVFPRMVFCWIPVIWTALVLFTIYSLQFIAYHEWSDLFALWMTTGATWLWTKWQRGHFQIKFAARKKVEPVIERSENVDALLDKIGTHGLHSLTASERRQLEKAREKLMGK